MTHKRSNLLSGMFAAVQVPFLLLMRCSYLAIALLSSCFCYAQSVSVGVKAGVPVLDDISGDATSESKRYIVGPMIEVGLPFGLGIELDALYQRVGFRTHTGSFAGTSFLQERLNTWQFPILLKYKLPIPIVKPYVMSGYVRRIMNGTDSFNDTQISYWTSQTSYSHSSSDADREAMNGFIVGSGVRFAIGKLQVSPELRYTRWIDTSIGGYGSYGYSYQANQNRLDLLVGLGWKVH